MDDLTTTDGGGGGGMGGVDPEELQKQYAGVAKLKASYETQGKAMGFDANLLKSMSAREVMGFVDGLKFRAAMGHAQAQEANQRMMTAMHGQALQAALGNEATGAALEGFAKRYGELAQPGSAPQEGDFANEAPPVATPGMDPRAALVKALGENPRAARSAQLDNLIGALKGAKDYLPMGQVMDLPGVGKLVGTGGVPHFAPTAVADDINVWEDPVTGERLARSGKSVLKLGTNPEKKATAGNWPWLLDEDPKKFLQGLQGVDPQERDLALATRIRVNHAMGKTDALGDLIKQHMDEKVADPSGPGFMGWVKGKLGLGSPQAPGKPTVDGAGGRVKVKGPDGKVGTVPREQLDEAKRSGYKVVE